MFIEGKYVRRLMWRNSFESEQNFLFELFLVFFSPASRLHLLGSRSVFGSRRMTSMASSRSRQVGNQDRRNITLRISKLKRGKLNWYQVDGLVGRKYTNEHILHQLRRCRSRQIANQNRVNSNAVAMKWEPKLIEKVQNGIKNSESQLIFFYREER